MNERQRKFREAIEKATLHPLMPTKYNWLERKALREFERELLTGSKDKNIKPKIDIEK